MEKSLKALAKDAKRRMKKGFWEEQQKELASEREKAREQGINENKLDQYFLGKVESRIKGDSPDEFYLRVKKMLLEEGEVSNAIGRLTDKEYYETLSYSEKQRYNLDLSERYLRALERFKREYEFEIRGRK